MLDASFLFHLTVKIHLGIYHIVLITQTLNKSVLILQQFLILLR